MSAQESQERAELDEGVLDPVVVTWLEENAALVQPVSTLAPEYLAMSRMRDPFVPPTTPVAKVRDTEIDGIGVRIYEHDDTPTGLVVYFHGGGFCLGGLGAMDSVARALAVASGAAVISVEYRLAPEHPFPAAVDDCEAVTRWALANAADFGVAPEQVAVAGESAGGNLAIAVSLRLRDADGPPLAGQLAIYPATLSGTDTSASRKQFSGVILDEAAIALMFGAYANEDDAKHPHAAPAYADSLAGLPPAQVVLAGCDPLRDEGRAFAARLREEGVDVEEVCYPGQPHGFINYGLPATADAMERAGTWLRARFAST